jgi:hypothetical protein
MIEATLLRKSTMETALLLVNFSTEFTDVLLDTQFSFEPVRPPKIRSLYVPPSSSCRDPLCALHPYPHSQDLLLEYN